MTSPEDQLRNVSALLKEYTASTRNYNGRGRGKVYPVDKETIASTARQLAEMVELYLDGELRPTDSNSPF